MGPLDLVDHLLSFLAPAFVVGFIVASASRWFLRPVATLSWWGCGLANTIAGSAVLAGGLWLFGVDAKMLTYAALVAVVAMSQWLCIRGWKG